MAKDVDEICNLSNNRFLIKKYLTDTVSCLIASLGRVEDRYDLWFSSFLLLT